LSGNVATDELDGGRSVPGEDVSNGTSEYRIKGRSYVVPATRIEGHRVIAVGRWLRIATLQDEEWLEGELVADPPRFVDSLRSSGLRADIFAYSGPIDSTSVHPLGRCDHDNVAVIRTDDLKAWWDGLPQEARKNTRRAAKKGIEVKVATFDDVFVSGIKAIYDETPVRQGRMFWHYGKALASVKRDNGTYLDRCEFLGAYLGGELVGFMKLVYVGNAGRIMQILCLNAHQDKRPIVALIARAAEICHAKGMKYLIYGKFTYGRKTDSSIAEFKRRLGFEQKNFPRYYVPLTWRGRMAVGLGAHAGWLAILPPILINLLLDLRSWWLARAARRLLAGTPGQGEKELAAAGSDAP
jgi:hypothetical protein